MTADDGFTRRLLVALADVSPALQTRPELATGGFGRRLLAALADAYPASHPIHTEEELRQSSSEPAANPAGRYVHIPEIDRRRTVPFDLLPAPERGAVMQRVQQLTESLEGAIDEGTSASLDRLIESWVGGWIATVESEYVDHCAVISIHRGQARHWLTEATVTAGHEREKLDRIQADYSACRFRLTAEQADQAIGSRSRTGPAAVALLVLAGALAVTVAFRNTVALALPTLSGLLAWLAAAGATSLAMATAASAGISLRAAASLRPAPRRFRPQAGRIGSGLFTILITVAWAGLGLAAILIPLLGTGVHSASLAALFSGTAYFTSGTCTIFLAEQLYDPDYSAFRRLERKFSAQARFVAKAEAERERAEAALEQHDGELQREDQRRAATIDSRRALGAEAASYARVLMASMLRDPAKATPTEAEPAPEPTHRSQGSA